MRITINKTGKPLNHRLLTIIYLICFLLGFCIQGYGEDTTKVTPIQRVEYRWQLYANLQRWYHTWRMLYGKPNRSQTHSVRTNSQPPSDTPLPPGRERQGQPLAPESRPAFLLASVVPKTQRHRTDARRGHCASPARSPGQRALHQEAHKLLRSGGEIWS